MTYKEFEDLYHVIDGFEALNKEYPGCFSKIRGSNRYRPVTRIAKALGITREKLGDSDNFEILWEYLELMNHRSRIDSLNKVLEDL